MGDQVGAPLPSRTGWGSRRRRSTTTRNAPRPGALRARHWRPAALVAALALVTLQSLGTTAATPAQASSVPTLSCGAKVAHRRLAYHAVDYWRDRFWRLYADSGKGWSGGDGGASVSLPGGRVAWLFNDSYVGKVVDGGRPRPEFVHNLIVLQHGPQLTTLHGGSRSHPVPFMTYKLSHHNWYWSNSGVETGGVLYVSYSSYWYPGTPSVYGFVRTGTVLAGFSLRTFHLISFRWLDNRRHIVWGVSMRRGADWVYVYGLRTSGSGSSMTRQVFLARAPVGHMLGPWQYYTGSGWAGTLSLAAPILGSVSSTFSVNLVDGVYVLTTMSPAFGSEAEMYFGCHPAGPFRNRLAVWNTSSTGGIYGTMGIKGAYTYGAILQPQLTRGALTVLSYDVNTSDWSLIDQNAGIVRPRYVLVRLAF